MALTSEQLATLKAAILADPVLAALPNTPDNNFTIAAAFNLPASPEFIVWRTSVEVASIMSNGFIWTVVDGLTAGKARIWDWMTRLGSINPSKPNIRQGIADCWGAGSAQVTAILPHCKRPASRAEALFATGTGSDATPGTMGWEGALSYDDIGTARNLP